MPLYDYRCEDCAKPFEARMPVERRNEAACPACGGRRVVRLMPLSVTVLTGGGPSAGPADDGDCCGGGCGESGCACAAEEDAAFA